MSFDEIEELFKDYDEESAEELREQPLLKDEIPIEDDGEICEGGGCIL